MLNSAESNLCKAIGRFSTIAQITKGDYISSDNYGNSSSLIPGQCAAFLTSSQEFIWFIEQYDVENSSLATLSNKKIYPAKVTGINLAFLGTQTFKWRDGLIQSNPFSESSYYPDTAFRPGFGQVIPNDLSRPIKSISVARNDLGLGTSAVLGGSFCGPLGRLMSMAFHVEEPLGKAYDASQSQKKKVPLNSQDKEQMPTYPTYDVYSSGSGY